MSHRPSQATVVATLVLGLAGCGVGATGTQTTPGTQVPSAAPATATSASSARRGHGPSRLRRHARRPSRQGGPAVSTAANDVAQPQPPAGSCHPLGSGLFSRPDPGCTPGALNPAVTQTTIRQTICVSGWTDTVRPPEAITEQEKAASLAAYGDGGPMSAYEYDHFVPLELGGATNDPRNLWPEPGASPNPKDGVEDELRAAVCDGRMSLARAQRAIVTNWVLLARTTTTTRTASATCTATAHYNRRYGDYDVYVHSNQPDQTATVSDAAGRRRSWHTDAAGYADVYFDAGGAPSGARVSVRAGAAACSATL